MIVLNSPGRLTPQRNAATLTVNVTHVQIHKHCSLQLRSTMSVCRSFSFPLFCNSFLLHLSKDYVRNLA